MTLRTLIASPLLHFLVLSGIIFAAYALLNDASAPPPPDRITITEAETERLAGQFRATWNRAPAPDELADMVQARVVEEALVREALILGLDRDDAVIRQRLRQKMLFIADAAALAEDPGDAKLEAFLTREAARFTTPALLAFSQILLPATASPAEAEALRQALADGDDPAELGAATFLPPEFPLGPATMVDRSLGSGFAEALADLPTGRWSGPVQSGYGLHLVKVTTTTPATLPPLAEIRDRVLRDWRADRAEAARAAFTDALLARYTVVLPDPLQAPQ